MSEEMSYEKVSVVKWIITLILFVMAVVGIVVGVIFVISGVTGMAEYIIPGVIILLLAMLFSTISENMGYKFCKKCRTKMDGCEYEYRTTRNYNTKDGQGNLKMRMTEVRIIATCPSCGKKKKFKKAFKSYNYNSGENYDVQYLVDEFCLKKFGH